MSLEKLEKRIEKLEKEVDKNTVWRQLTQMLLVLSLLIALTIYLVVMYK